MLRHKLKTIMAVSARMNQRPIVAVIGTTGVGKSNLAVSLAQSLQSARNHESAITPAVVLSADSMQLYKGLDVITNKVTEEEMGGVEHWGLDMVSPGEGGSWEVGKWCNEADKKIATLPSDMLPIICGGTHYFIQHFLFPPSELSFDRPGPATAKGKSPADSPSLRWTPPCSRPSAPADFDDDMAKLLDTFWTQDPIWPREVTSDNPPQASSSRSSRPTIDEDSKLLALHRLLSMLDPKEGGRWHWRDGRKVRRALERWWERGLSQEAAGDLEGEVKGTGREARFRTLIFWVYEPLDTLRPRLDKRVDKMVENGLLREIVELRGIAERIYGTAEATDHTEGIFQSIGYKEFAALELPQCEPARDPAYAPALERTKLSTHQYAKSQLKWIKKQLLPAVKEARSLGGEVNVYVVNGGEPGVNPAVSILTSFMNGEPLPKHRDIGHLDASALLEVLDDEDNSKVPDTADRQDLNARRECEICSSPGRPYSLSIKEWETHLKSKIHRRNAKPARDKDQWIAQQREQGELKRAEREKLKEEVAALRLQQTHAEAS
ncbi:uncharacterized protein I303_104703 [Kwoniella dejecticola CBS 10117]|uniref:tRNA dimethylallyltransferase n=1 Tax=Kwoniella dejecticola CBS 10117 TaxID=1296121 RepID=A0A1A6A4K2_9TREE|nr:tRNA dimethylallyltransferase [Kwoniella dejecticola CBS 10117]OBR84990.1 tRNA dimethylallyltransferase [Kwoniella dejecticola CBS 10117]